MDDLADVGSIFRRRKRRGSSNGGGGGGRNQPFGLGSTVFTNVSGTALTLEKAPLEDFQGRRLVVDVTKSAGAAGIMVEITSLMVGSKNQLPQGLASMPAAAFASTAVQGGWIMNKAKASVPIALGLAVSAAPAAGETVNVSALIHGRSY